MKPGSAVSAAAEQFAVSGMFVDAIPWGNGHIHDSYRVGFDTGGVRQHYLLQRINTGVFPLVPELMENIERVTAHIEAGIANEADRARRALRLVPARDCQSWLQDEQGACWRMFGFIEGSRSVDKVESAEQCYRVAQAFGAFQHHLTSLPGPRLHDTIPDFHHTPKRFAALERAIAADPARRASTAKAEIDFALARNSMTRALLDAGLPERVTHNDTKINNVLLDEQTGEALCVIDLDTVMPGLALYDFGDMVRTATSPAAEDEQDLGKVFLRMDYYQALVEGYLSSAAAFLTARERELLAFSGKLITFEIGTRFLADYLNGDTYFKVHREGHNLDRCRTQFRLVASIEDQEHQMNRLVAQPA
ncbi:MAG: aminoglycoside phosphotransferase family protein [Terracidiphilus sp.]